MTITPQLLLANGFQKYSSNLKRNTKGYIDSYSLRVDDEKGTKYFIHIDRCNYGVFDPTRKEDSFSAYSQFNSDSDTQNTFNVEFFIYPNTALDEIKDFYEKVFVRMEAEYEV